MLAIKKEKIKNKKTSISAVPKTQFSKWWEYIKCVLLPLTKVMGPAHLTVSYLGLLQFKDVRTISLLLSLSLSI